MGSTLTLRSGLASKTTSGSSAHPLPVAASFLLDLVRLSAALLVVVAHSGHPEFTTGFANRQILGDVAVPVFFVLSGFVIRYVTVSRKHTLWEYLVDRGSRMYSVILPVAMLTLVLTIVCARLDPHYFQQHFTNLTSHPWQRLLLNLCFLSQSWSHSTVFFIDSPFWSLSYECLYYLGYGFFLYLRGARRWLALLVWAGVAGPQVMFLLPAWALGCWVYDLYRSRHRMSLLGAAVALPAGVAVCALRNPLTLLHIAPYRATMMALGSALFAAGALLLVLRVSDRIDLAQRNVWLRRFRHLADGTFTIYLAHYPLMVLAQAAGGFRPATPEITLALLTGICATLVVAARPLDLLKVRLRGIFTSASSHRPEPSGTC